MTYQVKVTQIRSHNWVGIKYRIDVSADHGDKGWNDYDFMFSRVFTKHYARKLIKKNEGDKFQHKVVEEFEL